MKMCAVSIWVKASALTDVALTDPIFQRFIKGMTTFCSPRVFAYAASVSDRSDATCRAMASLFNGSSAPKFIA